jgi:hypothetical protein
MVWYLFLLVLAVCVEDRLEQIHRGLDLLHPLRQIRLQYRCKGM